jgi:DNA-binding response OmpR family regulator
MNSQRPTVLLIEDNDGLARILGLTLKSHGFNLRRVATGGEALETLRRDEVQGVILDLSLPDERGGEVLDWLSTTEQGSTLAWVVTSAFDLEEATRRYGPVGGWFVAKPFDPWDLVKTLDRLLFAKELIPSNLEKPSHTSETAGK